MATYRGGYVWRGSPALVAANAAIMAARQDGARPARYATGEAPHGTRAAYRRHKRHGETPCELCRQANALARRRWPGVYGPCGTTAGWNGHHKRGEEPCQPCKDAKAEYSRQRRAARPAGRRRDG